MKTNSPNKPCTALRPFSCGDQPDRYIFCPLKLLFSRKPLQALCLADKPDKNVMLFRHENNYLSKAIAFRPCRPDKALEPIRVCGCGCG
ncbi:MAG: hypothetical protein K9L30_06880 [Desulfobacterales bacterium]|nr:hypothetical protein [Desulfobacterales bacterium]